MLIEKTYSDNNHRALTQPDTQSVRELLEKYGVEDVFDVLNEKGWGNSYGGSFSGKFNATGGSTVKGISGVLQSIPSFAAMTLFSPTLTGLCAFGAICHRMQQRWENHESWRNRLMPGFWIDNLANPGGFSVPHRAADATGRVLRRAGAAVGTGALAAISWNKIKERYKKEGSSAPGWVKKLFGIGTAAGAINAAGSQTDSSAGTPDSSLANSPDLKLTPEDVKNIDFREYWLSLTNDEVYRVKADSRENAKKLGECLVTLTTMPGGLYEKMNAALKADPNIAKFTFYFNDGEICHSIGKDQAEARKAALAYRKEICKQINGADKGLMVLDKLSEPKIQMASTPKKGEAVPVPDKNQIKVDEVPPVIKQPKKKKLTVPVYAGPGISDYKFGFMYQTVHFPAASETEAYEMIRRYIRETAAKQLNIIDHNAKATQRQFRVKFKDGDSFYIWALSESDAREIGNNMHKAKFKTALMTMQNPTLLENILSEYDKELNEPVVDVIDMKKYREYKPSGDIGVQKIASAADELNVKYKKFKL